MADEPSFHEEFADADNADSYEITELNQRISDLEEENSKIVGENKEYLQGIKELKASVEKLSSENAELKSQVEKAESDNKVFCDVAKRAADLEGEASMLHQDLAMAMSDLQQSNVYLSGLETELKGMKGREKDKDVKLEAAEREKALLVVELDARDKQIQVFKRNVEELEAVALNGKGCESCLDEKESVIREVGLVNDGKRGLICGPRQREWMLVGGTAIATAAVMGCYIHAARKL